VRKRGGVVLLMRVPLTQPGLVEHLG
jgi:hypothetical protein